MIKVLGFSVLAVLMWLSPLHAEPWNLPAAISDANSKVSFEVDSTWHTVHGSAKNIEGRVWLADPTDYRTVKVDAKVPVASLDTGSSSRDEKMREVMHSEQVPLIAFNLTDAGAGLCDPATLSEGKKCNFVAPAQLNINNVAKTVSVEMEIAKEVDDYTIHGSTQIKWADFGIEDPSILIAKLYDDVIIDFSINLKRQG